jgi:hypothetical protein
MLTAGANPVKRPKNNELLLGGLGSCNGGTNRAEDLTVRERVEFQCSKMRCVARTPTPHAPCNE